MFLLYNNTFFRPEESLIVQKKTRVAYVMQKLEPWNNLNCSHCFYTAQGNQSLFHALISGRQTILKQGLLLQKQGKLMKCT